MKYRKLGKTEMEISEVSLGTWQLGAKWGEKFSEHTALKTLEHAFNRGVNFFDTADVYNDTLSELVIGKFMKNYRNKVYIATKCGRQLNPHAAEGYNAVNIRKFIEASLQRMGVEKLDLLQLHCPPTAVYYQPETFNVLEKLKQEGKILHYGVSVEKVEEALKAIDYPGVETVQLIYNIFRQRPSELLFEQALKRNIGIIIRVPLASGLLTGKFSKETVFNKDDHRNYNRDGALFDKGETFAGVDYEKGLEAVEELKELFGDTAPLSRNAIRWILMSNAVSTVIPGASKPEHIDSNTASSELAAFSEQTMQKITELYQRLIKADVHHLW